jgi:hypothetical protein
MSELN